MSDSENQKGSGEGAQAPAGNGKVGVVLVVGGGIAAMQAALDLGDSGYQVHMVTNQPSIGGNMVKLDKTFPTNDCSMCIVSPKLVTVGNHPNINIITMGDIEEFSGKPGNFKVVVRKEARYVDESKCTGCGECVERCPIQYKPVDPRGTEPPIDLKPEQIAVIDKAIDRHRHERGPLIAVLQDINSAFGYIPPESLRYVSRQLMIPLAKVYHVATFYTVFSLEPRGEHVIKVCMGTACHVRGAPRILDALENRLEIKAGHTTQDMKFTLETVNCLGSCAMGPAVVVDGKFVTLKLSGIDKMIKRLAEAEPAAAAER